ncbi:MAG: cation:proton antiporter [Candidatus Bilamarchaeaceae archaeon]
MMIETLIAFAIIAGIIFVGFLAEFLFRRFMVPPPLILLAAGLALGPVMHIVDVSLMLSIEYIVAPLALVILLLEGGLELNVYKIIHESGRGILLGGLGIGISSIAVALLWAALGHDIITGLILGVILSGTASEIVVPIAKGMHISDKAKQTLTIESAMTDVVGAVLVLSLIEAVISGHASVEGTTRNLVTAFSIGAVLGAIFGMAWLTFSNKLKQLHFYYMLTLALVLCVYIVTEFMGGSGAIAALMFGMMLGNAAEIGKMLKFKDITHEPKIVQFHEEISFLVRTFVFVFLGMIITVTNLNVVLIGIGITALLAATRFAALKVAVMKSDLMEFEGQMRALLPRGLATAILAMYPATMLADSVGKITPYSYWTLYNQFSVFPQIAFVVIITSIIFTAGGVRMAAKDVHVGGDEEGEEGKAAREEAEKARARADKKIVQKIIGSKHKQAGHPEKKGEPHLDRHPHEAADAGSGHAETKN